MTLLVIFKDGSERQYENANHEVTSAGTLVIRDLDGQEVGVFLRGIWRSVK